MNTEYCEIIYTAELCPSCNYRYVKKMAALFEKNLKKVIAVFEVIPDFL